MQNEAQSEASGVKCEACRRPVEDCQSGASCWDYQQDVQRLAALRSKGGRRTWQERAEYETLLRQVARPVAEEAPKCSCCRRPMLASREQHKDGSWMTKCWPCASAGFDHRCEEAK